MITGSTVGTVDNSECELFFEANIGSRLLKNIFGLYCAIPPRDEVLESLKTDTVLTLARIQRLHPLFSVLLGDGARRNRYLVNLGDGKPILYTGVVLRIDRKQQNLFAMQVFLGRIDMHLDKFFLSHFGSCSGDSVSGKTKTRQNFASVDIESNCARDLSIKTTGDRIAQHLGSSIVLTDKVGIRKTLELRENFLGANDNLIGVVSARELMAVKLAAKTALAVSIGIAGNGGPSSDTFAVFWTRRVTATLEGRPL